MLKDGSMKFCIDILNDKTLSSNSKVLLFFMKMTLTNGDDFNYEVATKVLGLSKSVIGRSIKELKEKNLVKSVKYSDGNSSIHTIWEVCI